MEKLLIVGIDTLAGSNLALTMADRCNIVGISDRSGFELPGCRTLPIRLSASEAVGESIVAERPAWIVYSGPTACSSWDCCDEQQSPHEPRQIAIVNEASKQCGSYLTLISTDAVFHGPRLFHRETFPKSHDRSAAIAAIEAEKAITADGALICSHTRFRLEPHRYELRRTVVGFTDRRTSGGAVWHSICHADLGKRSGRIALAQRFVKS